jgi:hypothetical protein
MNYNDIYLYYKIYNVPRMYGRKATKSTKQWEMPDSNPDRTTDYPDCILMLFLSPSMGMPR